MPSDASEASSVIESIAIDFCLHNALIHLFFYFTINRLLSTKSSLSVLVQLVNTSIFVAASQYSCSNAEKINSSTSQPQILNNTQRQIQQITAHYANSQPRRPIISSTGKHHDNIRRETLMLSLFLGKLYLLSFFFAYKINY